MAAPITARSVSTRRLRSPPTPSLASAAGFVRFDDQSDAFAMRQRVDASTSGGYRHFLQDLKPHYGQVCLHIGLAYATLAAGLAAPVALSSQSILTSVAGAAFSAVWIGYWMAYLQLFIHEAAHYNIASTRWTNDLLCNLFISSWTAAYIKAYRENHFGHHRGLGTTRDTENSYFNAPTPRFLMELLFLAHAFRIVRQRAARISIGPNEPSPFFTRLPSIASVALHGVLIAGLIATRQFYAVAAWIAGMGMVYPFFAGLRQLLEHRDVDARADADYHVEPHGAVTRLFHGPLSSTFGGAGFSRHLLHHWEPQVSYTRLSDLEAFLAQTEAARIMDARRTTYFAALRQLVCGRRHVG